VDGMSGWRWNLKYDKQQYINMECMPKKYKIELLILLFREWLSLSIVNDHHITRMTRLFLLCVFFRFVYSLISSRLNVSHCRIDVDCNWASQFQLFLLDHRNLVFDSFIYKFFVKSKRLSWFNSSVNLSILNGSPGNRNSSML
jgi:hypothetical protein